MAKLVVRDFACIKNAELDFAPFTLVVGPQASGKSILCKLYYFFVDFINTLDFHAQNLGSGDDLKEYYAREFVRLFPSPGWGSKPFKIAMTAGDLGLYVSRDGGSGHSALGISFSPFVDIEFSRIRSEYDIRMSEFAKDPELANTAPQWALTRDIRDPHHKRLASAANEEVAFGGTFIPAGRSFFTTLGKAATVGFDRDVKLDPVTERFGRRHLSHKNFFGQEGVADLMASKMPRRAAIMKELFGGVVAIEKDQEFIVWGDGRKLPGQTLSSGQQELLPLWMSLDWCLVAPSGRVFIEEPEAHLFPRAQSTLTGYLAEVLNASSNRLQMVISTHSPYVLSTVNNLLKAGTVGADPEKADDVAQIIPREAWLSADKVAAYAIADGVVRPIMTEDGLLDGEYLDEISNTISEQFLNILEIQYADQEVH